MSGVLPPLPYMSIREKNTFIIIIIILLLSYCICSDCLVFSFCVFVLLFIVFALCVGFIINTCAVKPAR